MSLVDALSGKVSALNSLKSEGQDYLGFYMENLNNDSFIYNHYRGISIAYCELCRVLFESSASFKSNIKTIKFLPLLKYTASLITANLMAAYTKSPKTFLDQSIDRELILRIATDCHFEPKDNRRLSALVFSYFENSDDKRAATHMKLAREYLAEATNSECDAGDLYNLLVSTDYILDVYCKFYEYNVSNLY